MKGSSRGALQARQFQTRAIVAALESLENAVRGGAPPTRVGGAMSKRFLDLAEKATDDALSEGVKEEEENNHAS